MNTQDNAGLAMVAEAAYADFSKGSSDVEVQKALVKEKFSVTQAKTFTDLWEMVHHQPDTESGFSATLSKSTDPNASQPYVLAIRGTDPNLQDLIITNVSDIVVDGLAIDQIVDLWNYWKQLITPKGTSFVGSQLVTLEEETAALALAKAGQFLPGFNLAADAYLAWLYSRDDIIIDNGPLGERVRTIEQVIPAPAREKGTHLFVRDKRRFQCQGRQGSWCQIARIM
jgi:hypothetical protein